jgi:hypothetical protein
MDLGLGREQFGEYAPEPQRLLEQLGPQPPLAGGGGVALVEHEVDDLEHGREAPGEIPALGDLERDASR